ncbi:hypothetical protein F5Y12DRAFT_253242 [Xylaria sp. FL1777]|nr:hypothetical protein F5Y12DRAFT_253242 [Xylaria sp. FL1777]
MPSNTDTPATSTFSTTEQDRVSTIMATLPPIKTQDPVSAHDTEANAHNAAILAVRGLHTTATGYELAALADMALSNNDITTTPAQVSSDDTASAGEENSPSKPGEQDKSSGEDVGPDTKTPVITFKPFYFFFYGSLQIRSILQCVCDTPDDDDSSTLEDNNKEDDDDDDAVVVLRERASIEGWKIKMWGPYPALIPAAPDEKKPVHGVAWLCERPEHVAKLCMYETRAYRMAYCNIMVPAADGDGIETLENARTFVSTVDHDQLTDGEFSIEAYQRETMGWWGD